MIIMIMELSRSLSSAHRLLIFILFGVLAIVDGVEYLGIQSSDSDIFGETSGSETFSVNGILNANSKTVGSQLDPKTYFKADKGFITRQRAVIKAFTHYRCPSEEEQDDFYVYSKTFNPLSHLQEYSNGTRVAAYVKALETGKLLTRYEMFSFETHPLDQFKNLILILNDAFLKDPKLFYKTLAYFFSRNNVIELYTAVTIVVSSLRTEGYRLPPPYEAIPQFYTPKDIIYQANRIQLEKTHSKRTFIVSRTGMSLPEEPLAYFRDDTLLNTFHFLWHADFPSWYDQSQFPAKKYRKGELFLNLHHNLVARYFAERISLGFPKITQLDMRQPINPGFKPNMMNLNYEDFPLRGADVFLKDLVHENITTSVNQTIATITDLRQGVLDGYLVATNGSQVSIRNDPGSNVVGNSIESSVDSINRGRYGNYHNFGHLLISRVMDPDDALKLPAGAILHQETSMMDPVFYQLHYQIDQINKLQKDYLPPYSKSELDYPGVNALEFSVQTDATAADRTTQNQLQTEFRNVSWDISNSLEEIDDKCSKIRKSQVYANVRQVRNKDFTYTLIVASNRSTQAVVRIFMAPMDSYEDPDIDNYRWSFFEMDKFPVQLSIGNNTITRKSQDNSFASSPFVSIRSLNEAVDRAYLQGTPLYVNRYTRHCGWPTSYYLPIGRKAKSPEGPMRYWLFAMLTDFKSDYLIDFDTASRLKAESSCTVVDGPIPDKRPMGFPFDKPIASLPAFYTSNMIMTDVNVTHVN